MIDLERDTALLHVTNAYPTTVDVLLQSSDCYKDIEMRSNSTPESEQGLTEKKARERLRSLDTFRGFVFIMGTSMALSFRGMRKRTSTRRVVFRVITRSAKLFLVGFFLNAGHGRNDLGTVRVPGVLQRLSIAYLVSGFIECFVGKERKSSDERSRLTNPTLQKIHNALRDIVDNWAAWLLHLLILVIHLIITFLLPVPGCPTGYLGPGGPLLGDGVEYLNCTGGAAGYIDRLILGSHMYQTPTVRVFYKTKVAFDPEGILGSLTTIFNCFLGLQAGKILVYYKEHSSRIIRWGLWAVLMNILYDYFPFFWRGVPLTHPHLLTMDLVGTTLWVIIAVYLHHIKFYVKI
uniref:Heparan-alpha-glucosaminide N-acetyltransferase catalytic domain-containing protein n=1 Tax=Branchiostoma floridae TaxID=7739 RepID=C3ZMD4_BRAFL|eukprot:XP_002590379.1 hypothetical protein BRAFLDRAFT_76652 [Branchiostoma floridae]